MKTDLEKLGANVDSIIARKPELELAERREECLYCGRSGQRYNANHRCSGKDMATRDQLIPGTALRYNEGKPPLHLLSGRWLEEVAAVMAYGATKYEKDNWRKGGPWAANMGSVLRHINTWMRGEELDPESGRHHLAHAICGLFFVLEWVLLKKGTDDRYKGPDAY